MDALPYSILQEIRQLKSDIAALKGANQLLLSAIQGGKLVVLNENGVQVMLAGLDPQDSRTRWAAYSDLGERVAQAGNIAGTAFDNGAGFRANTRFNTSGFMVNDSGIVFPLISWPISMAPEFANGDTALLTSGTFARVFYVDVQAIPSDALTSFVTVAADVGTSIEMKWVDANSGATTAVKTHVGSNAYTSVPCNWTHGIPLMTTSRFELQARRSAGAGSARVARPHKFLFSSKEYQLSTSGGW
jgi:hypothetical protein